MRAENFKTKYFLFGINLYISVFISTVRISYALLSERLNLETLLAIYFVEFSFYNFSDLTMQ